LGHWSSTAKSIVSDLNELLTTHTTSAAKLIPENHIKLLINLLQEIDKQLSNFEVAVLELENQN
jgi:hypothetical protein